MGQVGWVGEACGEGQGAGKAWAAVTVGGKLPCVQVCAGTRARNGTHGRNIMKGMVSVCLFLFCPFSKKQNSPVSFLLPKCACLWEVGRMYVCHGPKRKTVQVLSNETQSICLVGEATTLVSSSFIDMQNAEVHVCPCLKRVTRMRICVK